MVSDENVANATANAPGSLLPILSINPLLKALRPSHVDVPEVGAAEIALAVSNIFTNQLSTVQAALLLYNLSLTGLEQRPDVLAQCANAMRDAAEPVDTDQLKHIIRQKGQRRGEYHGGLCDIVGTGGDGHSTFNISTTSSILASSLLLVAKHGNRASTSKSGSADVLALLQTPTQPNLSVVSPAVLAKVYERTNYAFLFAPNFHKGMKHIAPVRKEMPNPTIFNLLGPLTNPVEAVLEARMIGVKKRDLVEVFAEALKLNGAKKAMVVCGAEDLDEISCAGKTYCARLQERRGHKNAEEDREVDIEHFTLEPEDFGLPAHPLNTVSPGLTPEENASILHKLLTNQLQDDDPILHFVLMNTAALFVVAGVCETDEAETIKEVGPGGGRWKEGMRLAKMAISSGKAFEMIRGFAEITSELSQQ